MLPKAAPALVRMIDTGLAVDPRAAGKARLIQGAVQVGRGAAICPVPAVPIRMLVKVAKR